MKKDTTYYDTYYLKNGYVSYLIITPTKQVILIDPSFFDLGFFSFIQTHQLSIHAIMLTSNFALTIGRGAMIMDQVFPQTPIYFSTNSYYFNKIFKEKYHDVNFKIGRKKHHRSLKMPLEQLHWLDESFGFLQKEVNDNLFVKDNFLVHFYPILWKNYLFVSQLPLRATADSAKFFDHKVKDYQAFLQKIASYAKQQQFENIYFLPSFGAPSSLVAEQRLFENYFFKKEAPCRN